MQALGYFRIVRSSPFPSPPWAYFLSQLRGPHPAARSALPAAAALLTPHPATALGKRTNLGAPDARLAPSLPAASLPLRRPRASTQGYLRHARSGVEHRSLRAGLALTALRTADWLKLPKHLRPSRQRTAAANWRQTPAGHGQWQGTKFLRGRRAEPPGTPPGSNPVPQKLVADVKRATCVCSGWLAWQGARC